MVTGRPSSAIRAAISSLTGGPAAAQGRQSLRQGGIVQVEAVAEQVEAPAVVFHGQLNARDEVQADPLGRRPRFVQPAQGVVVGDGQCLQSQLVRRFH